MIILLHSSFISRGEYNGKEYVYTYFLGERKNDGGGNFPAVCKLKGEHYPEDYSEYIVNVVAYDNGKYIINKFERR